MFYCDALCIIQIQNIIQDTDAGLEEYNSGSESEYIFELEG